MPKISIIVPVYNSEKFLKRCIDSILCQSFKDFELILVDDGSKDSSKEICKSYCERDERVSYIYQENGGVSTARNRGISAAKGEYIAFVDSDDYIAEKMYEVLHDLIVKNDADISVCSVKEVKSENFEREIENRESDERVLIFSREEALKNLFVGKFFTMYSVNKLYKRSLFDSVRYPVGKIYEDTVVTSRLFSISEKIVYTSKVFYYYIKLEGSITNSKFSKRDLDVIDAGKYALDLAEKYFPNLISEAEYRYFWSYVRALDLMILSEDFKNYRQEYSKITSFLRENKFKILKNPYFNLKRKISLAVIMISKSLYRLIVSKFY